jgi:hypothetical protein
MTLPRKKIIKDNLVALLTFYEKFVIVKGK